jgi:hypothetical protein
MRVVSTHTGIVTACLNDILIVDEATSVYPFFYLIVVCVKRASICVYARNTDHVLAHVVENWLTKNVTSVYLSIMSRGKWIDTLMTQRMFFLNIPEVFKYSYPMDQTDRSLDGFTTNNMINLVLSSEMVVFPKKNEEKTNYGCPS